LTLYRIVVCPSGRRSGVIRSARSSLGSSAAACALSIVLLPSFADAQRNRKTRAQSANKACTKTNPRQRKDAQLRLVWESDDDYPWTS